MKNHANDFQPKPWLAAWDGVIEAFTQETITVCSACLQASCWQGIFFCEDYTRAGTVEKRREALKALTLEHSDDWKNCMCTPDAASSHFALGVTTEGL